MKSYLCCTDDRDFNLYRSASDLQLTKIGNDIFKNFFPLSIKTCQYKIAELLMVTLLRYRLIEHLVKNYQPTGMMRYTADIVCWLKQISLQRWVWAYRAEMATVINTNNGLERQNKLFKYNYLEQQKSSSLSRMITILITEYLPAMMLR